MGAKREGFNLFNKYQRATFICHIKHHWSIPWNYVWGDTFGPSICAVMGHVPFKCSDPNEPIAWACRRCGRRIGVLPPKE